MNIRSAKSIALSTSRGHDKINGKYTLLKLRLAYHKRHDFSKTRTMITIFIVRFLSATGLLLQF